jgi:hypothetical protein
MNAGEQAMLYLLDHFMTGVPKWRRFIEPEQKLNYRQTLKIVVFIN